MIVPITLSLSILLPAIAGVVCLIKGGGPESRRLLSTIAVVTGSVTTLLTVITSLEVLPGGERIIISLPSSFGISTFSFVVDTASVVFGLIVSFVGTLIILFSEGYVSPMNKEHPIKEGYGWFYGMMLIFMASMMGVVYSYSLVTMLLFYELTGVCSWSLIGFYFREKKSIYGAEKALFITHLGGLFLAASIPIVYHYTGGVTLGHLRALPPQAKAVAILFIAIACWSKSAQLPFWTWLPDAMVAPTPVSAYLHAAAMVKVGPILLFRTVQYASPLGSKLPLVLGVMAIATMVYGLLMYVPQIDMKRLLAYSTITQLSYMFLALSFASLGMTGGLKAAVYHVWNHAYAKALFFLTAGALAYATGSKNLTDYSGLIEKSPLLAASFGVAAFAISGVPPLNCFYSKYLVFTSGFQTYALWAKVLTLIAIGESVCCFIVFLYWFIKCVLNKPSKLVSEAQDITLSMKLSLAILIIMCLASAYILYPLLPTIGFAGGG